MDIEIGSGIIRVSKTTYKEKEYIDVRKYYQDKDTGEWKPTRKGITFNPELKDKVIEGLQQL